MTEKLKSLVGRRFHTTPVTCHACLTDEHADCLGDKTYSKEIRATTKCECAAVGHVSLLDL